MKEETIKRKKGTGNDEQWTKMTDDEWWWHDMWNKEREYNLSSWRVVY